MHRLPTVFFILIAFAASAQLPLTNDELYARIGANGALPQDLLSTKTAVFFQHTISEQETRLMQEYFHRLGIDAVVYYDLDYLTGGRDLSMAMAQYLINREITNLVLVRKIEGEYEMIITPYNKKANFVDDGVPTWREKHRLLEEILKSLNRTASYELKRSNFLVNEFPESGQSVDAIFGRRGEYYAVDLKIDPVAVPKFNNEELDRQLEELMKSYPYKYTLTDPNLSEQDLRKQGLLYVLRFVTAKAGLAKQLLGYEVKDGESSIVSVSYPNDQPVLKSIDASDQVFKFYFKHIDSQNLFLGTAWDADTDWHSALENQIKGFKKELKVE